MDGGGESDASFALDTTRAFEVVGVPATTLARSDVGEGPLAGLALVPAALAPGASGPRFRAVPDGNRAAILPDVRVVRDGRVFFASVKGVGAGSPLYGEEPTARRFHGESWMGEAPYGGQGEAGARFALEVTALASATGPLAGVPLCPVQEVVTIPDEVIEHDRFRYRRHRGAFVQEHRLVPSDVRLYHGGARVLGRDTEGVLGALGVRDVASLDAFVERYLGSGLLLLTLFARTARPGPGELVVGLDFDDAWLDKDSIVAPDGTLFFADLEALEWKTTAGAHAVRRQLDRNHYELFYGLDAMLDVRDAWTDTALDPASRRASVIARLGLALAGDRGLRAITHAEGLDVEVTSALLPPARVRLVDWR